MGDNKGKTVQGAASASKENLVPPHMTDAQKIVQLEAAVNALLAKTHQLETFKGIKANKAKSFNGKRSTLRRYLTSMDMYIRINNLSNASESNKVLFAGTYLTRAAFDWFEPFMRDFQENPKRADRKDSTDAVFDSYAGFKK
jgi:hypothetical protein